jgi:hypothetical protein
MAKLSLTPNPTFNTKAGIPIPGETKPVEVSFTFKHMDREALDKWLKALDGKEKTVAFQEIVSGWELTDPFSADSVKLFLSNYMAAFDAVLAKYLTELTGQREKN